MNLFPHETFISERRLISFGLEQFSSRSERSESDDAPERRPHQPTDQDESFRRQERDRRSEQEAADHKAEEAVVERRLRDGIAKIELTSLLKEYDRTIAEWRSAPEVDVQAFKEQLRTVLELPQEADFLVRPNADRGNLTLQVYDRNNPLHIYAQFSRPWGTTTEVEQLQRDLPLEDHPNIQEAVRDVLNLGSEFDERSADVEILPSNQVTLADSQTGKAVHTGREFTQLKLTDRITGKELGSIEYDERHHTVVRKSLNEKNVGMILNPNLSDFGEELLVRLNEGGEQQELVRRAVLNKMLELAGTTNPKGQQLIRNFYKRPILVIGKPGTGDVVEITAIDKSSGIVIGEIPYNTRQDEIDGISSLPFGNMRKALNFEE